MFELLRGRVGERSMNVPELDDAALYGVAGDVVRALAPQTEAHPAALLGGFLTMFGNALGAGPHLAVGADRHGARLHFAIVGATARARKGTAGSLIRHVMAEAQPTWSTRIVGGFGSGESVVDAVSDDVENRDHRLMVREPEFARILSVASRDGSILSQVIREAWDGGQIAVRSRGGGSVTATGAHVSVLADVTVEELRRSLTSTMVANGFANRFMYLLVHRPHRLPSGGDLPPALLTIQSNLVSDVLDIARRIETITRSAEADAAWHVLYQAIPDDEIGVFGAIVARAEAHLLRLGVTYAALDGSRTIELEHLRAAAAVWDYARASALAIWGESTGDPYADRLYAALVAAGEDGLSRDEVHKVFSRHLQAKQVDALEENLIARGLATAVEQPTGGRPTHRLFIASEAQQARELRMLDLLPSLSSLRSPVHT